MENLKNEGKDPKKKNRPAQRLYVPPAQRNKNKVSKSSLQSETSIVKEISCLNTESVESKTVTEKSFKENKINCSSNDSCQVGSLLNVDSCTKEETKENNSTNNEEQSLILMLDNMKTEENDKNIDVDKEEMERAIVNINRKTRPLIKHVNVGNKDVLHIDIDDRNVKLKKNTNKSKKISAIIDEQVANWEDLFNGDDQISGEVTEQISNYIGDDEKRKQEDSDGEDEEEITQPKKNTGPNDLDHVIELYDFPSSFKTQDLIQLYSDVNNESMYVKWCDETHALLVLSSPNQAKKALNIQHAIIKSRVMNNASIIAGQVASRVDLKPAMKRPQTNMQTARRLINSHLGTKSKLSKEEHAREREELRKAKELKRVLKQSENDAWDGHPRPSTA